MDHLIRRIARVDSTPELVPALAVGKTLDLTYELVDQLGAGGMGIVYRARDHRLGRDVAVKTVRPSSDDEHLRRLFEREARATAQLLHPNIVTLHHVGEHDGHPYLVLELLVGETLATRLTRRGRLPIGEALAVIDSVLCALAFAHERGVLHRDLKPNNVFLTSDERIKVLDFGVALELDTAPGPVTRSAGTPGYMAPEQRDGKTQDARTDVWAAALLLVECLIGRRPDEQSAASSLAEIESPRALREVLARALAADPATRPQSANELRVALTRAGGRFSVQAPKHSSKAQLVALALVMAAAGGAAAYLASRPSKPGGFPTPAELGGAWDTGLFGTMQLQVEPDGTAYGVYHWDDGIIVGNYKNGVLVGKWCELPSRRAPDDGGRLQITFVRGAHRIMVDGVWSYGETGAWQKDWTGSRLDSLPPIELEQRLNRRVPCP